MAAFALAVLASPVQAAPAGAVDSGPCVAFDALGYRYIAFGRTGVAESGIYLATNRSGTWRVSRHPVARGQRCAAILIDATRHVHLLAVDIFDTSTVDFAHLWYATDRSGSWRSSKAHDGEIPFASLAIDRTGRANIAVQDEDGVFLLERSVSGGWIIRADASGRVAHIRTSPGGELSVVIADAVRRRLVLWSDGSGAWRPRVVPRLDFTLDFDLAVDRFGHRSLILSDQSSGRVRIYRDLGSIWSLVGGTTAYPGRFLFDADVEPSGVPHVLLRYWRSSTSSGFVDMNRHDGVWHTQLIGYGSFWADMAIDTRGRVAGAFDRDGVVWSYWNDWKGAPHRFAISSL